MKKNRTETDQPAVDTAMDELSRALCIQAAEAESEQAAEIVRQVEAQAKQAGDNWNLVEWAIGILNQLEAAEVDIKQRAKDHLAYLLSEAHSRRAGLLWKLGPQIRELVDAKLVGKKRKSITYATGKAGYRKTAAHTSLVMDDEVKALAWAKLNCRAAVVESVAREVLSAHCHKSQTLPDGCHWETTAAMANFYVGPVVVSRMELEAEPGAQPKQISQRQSAAAFLTGEVSFDER